MSKFPTDCRQLSTEDINYLSAQTMQLRSIKSNTHCWSPHYLFGLCLLEILIHWCVCVVLKLLHPQLDLHQLQQQLQHPTPATLTIIHVCRRVLLYTTLPATHLTIYGALIVSAIECRVHRERYGIRRHRLAATRAISMIYSIDSAQCDPIVQTFKSNQLK